MRGFSPTVSPKDGFSAADALALLGLGVLVYAGVRLSVGSPPVVDGPDISSNPADRKSVV